MTLRGLILQRITWSLIDYDNNMIYCVYSQQYSSVESSDIENRESM